MNYRQRCYRSYVTHRTRYSCSAAPEAYELYALTSRKRFGDLLPGDRAARILDVGCGAGFFLSFLQGEGYVNARGIDLSAEQLEAARRRGVDRVEQADLFRYLPERVGAFEMLVAFDIIEHLNKEEILAFLDLSRRALVGGGRILLGTGNAQALLGAGMVFTDFTHETGFTAASLAQVLRVCGFEEVGVYGEKPVAHDFRSACRKMLWGAVSSLLGGYAALAGGSGRGFWTPSRIFEPRIYAVARNPDE